MPRASASHIRQVLALGAAITLVMAAADAGGLLAGWERLTWDLRFEHARLRAAPMSDSIRHVDIDDKAISNVGRWPWRRSRIAMAVDEIGRAGAKVVAFDLLFSDPEEPTWQQAQQLTSAPNAQPEFRKTDHDAILADAFSRIPSVLALNLGAPDSLGKEWAGEKGRRELDALLDVFTADVSTPDDEAAKKAGLTGDRLKQFRLSPAVYRSLAASRAAADILRDDEHAEFKALVRRVAPVADEHTASFPELASLQLAWDQRRAWLALRPALRGAGATPEAPPDPDDRAPISLVAAAAVRTGGAGFVDFVPDPDGAVRTVAALRNTPTGEAVQFGLAAAARFMGVAPDEIKATPGEIVIGTSRLPRLHDGRLLLDYPSVPGGFLNVLQRGADRNIGQGHVSIGALIDLAEQRAKIESNVAKLAAVTRLALGIGNASPVGEGEIARALEQGKDLIPQLRAILAKGETLDEQERNALDAFTQQAVLAEEVGAGPERLAAKEADLRKLLGGKLVFVGWSSTGAIADFVKTPLGSRTPGVVIHAVTADMALSGRAVRPTPAWLGPALAALLGFTASMLVARATPVPSAITCAAIALGYAGFGGVLFFNWWPLGSAPRGVGIMLPLVSPLLALSASFFGCTALEAALSQRDRLRIERQFKARVSGQLVEFLVDNPNALSMSGQQREICSLFIDLAGFTAISERLDGPTTVATLNRCMRDMTACLTAEGAYVNKFLGDGLMAFWSAFGEDPQQARRACRAAVACLQAVEALNKDPMMRGMPHLSARIGIATGTVVVGDCGAPPDLNDYTVIGNEVNLAARLESANKQFGTSILIDGRTKELLGEEGEEKEKYRLRGIGKVVVVGQTKAVDVYELMPPDADSIRIELTTRAVELFQRGDLMICLAVWKQLEDEFGDAKLADAYRENAADQNEAVASQGAIRLRSK